MKIFGREPALILGLLSAGVQMVTALFLPLTMTQVAAINSIAAAGLGVWTAFATRNRDGGTSIKPAVLGFTQAAITLGLVFGVSLTDQQTAAIMAFVALVGALFVRQVSTPAGTPGAVPDGSAAGSPVPAGSLPGNSFTPATGGGVSGGAIPDPPPADAAG
ncbi:hypothetical protein [Nonomuraea zeae]|uniref:hypothetical protein n=1 Tax=Nonomuraea zeae TaxID=1642303 RepID=UPI0014785F2A|nr:hypothetical protein [Nonomuraea zeae]